MRQLEKRRLRRKNYQTNQKKQWQKAVVFCKGNETIQIKKIYCVCPSRKSAGCFFAITPCPKFFIAPH